MAEGVQIRPAVAEDLLSFARRRCVEEDRRALYVDLARVAPGGAFVAADAGTPIGIAVLHALEDERFLSEIFVEPSFRGEGIAKRLLEACEQDAESARSGCVAANEMGALSLFLRRGIALESPIVRIAGSIPHPNEVARMAAGEYRFTTEPIDWVRDRSALAQLDREVRGSARPSDHGYFAEHGSGFAFRRGSELAGYVYVWPSGRIGPLAAASANYLIAFFAFALETLRQKHGASWCTALVPGANVRILRAALRAGFAPQGVHLFATDGGHPDLSRYVGFDTLLF
jgi:GNAT superfamily N-acetyltransferase